MSEEPAMTVFPTGTVTTPIFTIWETDLTAFPMAAAMIKSFSVKESTRVIYHLSEMKIT